MPNASLSERSWSAETWLSVVWVASRRAGPRAERLGPRALIEGCAMEIAGLACVAIAVSMIDRIAPVPLALVLVIFGLGQGMVMAPLYALVLSKVPAVHAGSGAGVLSTVRQIGNASGAAVVGAPPIRSWWYV